MKNQFRLIQTDGLNGYFTDHLFTDGQTAKNAFDKMVIDTAEKFKTVAQTREIEDWNTGYEPKQNKMFWTQLLKENEEGEDLEFDGTEFEGAPKHPQAYLMSDYFYNP